MKLYTKEIEYCDECGHFRNSKYIKAHCCYDAIELEQAILLPDMCAMVIPDWCKLEDVKE